MTTAVPQPLSLRKNIAWAAFGNFTYTACQAGVLVALAKLGSSLEVGLYSLGLAVTAPVIAFSNLQLRQILVTDAKNDHNATTYWELRLLTNAIAALVILALAFMSGYGKEEIWVILVLGLAKILESQSELALAFMQKHERMDVCSISSITKGVGSLAALSITYALTHSLVTALLAMAGVWLLMLLFYDTRQAIKMLRLSGEPEGVFRPRWHWRTDFKLIWLAVPLGIVMMLLSLNVTIPRLYIEKYLGTRTLGLFSGLAYVMVASQVFITAIGQTASPRLSKYYSEGKKRAFLMLLMKLQGMGLVVSAIGVMVAYFFGKPLLHLVYSKEYMEYDWLLVWIMAVNAIRTCGQLFGYGITSARRFKVQVIISTLGTGVCWVAALLFIPAYGLWGAILTMTLLGVAMVGANGYVVAQTVQRMGPGE